MSYHVQPPRKGRSLTTVVLAVCLALLALSLVAGWAASKPVRVMVDGVPRSMRAGTTIGELADRRLLKGDRGDLIGIDGSVVRAGGGEPPAVMRNGRVARFSQRLYSGDVVTSARGTDRRERIVSVQAAVPFKTRYEGSGSITELKELGAPGVRRVTRGEVSGIEVTSTVLREPADMVIARVRPGGGKLVALTFDDGPWPGQTERILEILEANDVKATFFVVGKQVKRHPSLTRRIVREGHGIGTHTYSHVSLTRVPPKEARRQVLAGVHAVERATGEDTRWIRPPYGAIDARSWKQIRSMKLRVVLWDVDSRDWERPNSRRLEQVVVRTTKPGSVVLFHDGGGDRRKTIAALPRIIRRLKAKGYTFVTVDELVDAKAAAKREKAREAEAKRKVEKGAS